MYNSLVMKKVKEIKNFTLMDLRNFLNTMSEEELANSVLVGFKTWGADGDSYEECEFVSRADFGVDDVGKKFVNLYVDNH